MKLFHVHIQTNFKSFALFDSSQCLCLYVPTLSFTDEVEDAMQTKNMFVILICIWIKGNVSRE